MCVCVCVVERLRGRSNAVIVCAAIIGAQQTYSLFFLFQISTLTPVLKVKVWANQQRRPWCHAAFCSVVPWSVFVPLSEQTVHSSRGFHRLSTGPLLVPFVVTALPHFLFCSPHFLPLQFKRMDFLIFVQKKKKKEFKKCNCCCCCCLCSQLAVQMPFIVLTLNRIMTVLQIS